MTITQIEPQIFNLKPERFEKVALEIFRYQYEHTSIYNLYIKALGISVDSIQSISQIPFLPIQFFKSHEVISSQLEKGHLIFESSGTTGQIPSRHVVQDVAIYETSMMHCFESFFGKVNQYCILGLLPSYLERTNSSLVYMVNHLIQKSLNQLSGFYLHNHADLHEKLSQLEKQGQATILIGVTYALLDFAEKFPMRLKNTIIVETGGMKGRREELLREEVHNLLKSAFCLKNIYSEYGMTELLSQAYSSQNGIFQTPKWMKVLIRDLNDPFQISNSGKGAFNIIDLANIHSCSFIATEDIGEVDHTGNFMVNGRMDKSELRGCSLMVP